MIAASTTNPLRLLLLLLLCGAALALPAALPQLSQQISNIFSLSPQAYESSVATTQSPAYDDYDFYVPYRSDTHDHFSWELLRSVLRQEPANVIMSPFSVKLVLALLSEAAGNNSQTQRELYGTLTDIRQPDNLRGFYKKVLSSLKKANPYYVLNLETRIFGDVAIEPQQRYAAMLQSYYDTAIERLTFADAQRSAAAINGWCANATNGRLQQLVSEEQVENNVLFIANVLYFNGLWRRPFNNSYEGVFFRTADKQQRAEYMEQTDYFYYYSDPGTFDAKILRLPYKGKKFSMFVLLPKTMGTIDRLMHELANDQVKRMQWMMEETKVRVMMPKFRFDFNKNLKSTLQSMGINDIFTDEASLPGLARGAAVAGTLKVSNIFQKSGIDVNERGTEAYAATVVEIDNKFGGSSMIEEFNVNQPFIFFIEEEVTGNIIFAGKVLEPAL